MDHKNLTRDALSLTSNRVYRWRLLLEEYAPEIVYIKGIHDTVADAISKVFQHLDYAVDWRIIRPYTVTPVQVRGGF